MLVRTGMGPRKAGAVVGSLLERERFQGIVSFGFAGGLAAGWRVGDLVIPEEVLALPPLSSAVYAPDPSLAERTRTGARKSGWTVRGGRMLTSQRVVCSPKEKARLGRLHGAGSVEMESAVLADLARRAGIPLLVVRVISDEVGFALPETLVLPEHLRRREFRKALRVVLAQPLGTVQLLRLMRHTGKASRRLTRFLLEEVLDTLASGGVGPGRRVNPC